MGFSKKSQTDGGCGLDSEGKKWLIAGIAIRTSLKPINTKPRGKENEDDEEESPSTTPTAKEARIPERLPCPPAPRKRRPPSRCNFNGVREFFTPPDLETVFKLHVEKAN
ncbi:Cyclin-dependent protein kinase inhibitor SMR6 [Melia azedarach]|uniref:Cyclin-dependent protein kinase inhibitor SMR6 n=1 Tax=Melia azedarach TaxID=155640 RepID=A0ACC1Z1M2_MELAZ|nr:Cyclin-dependent protein kinase inhibitor SMR6 [Melia azedarach]